MIFIHEKVNFYDPIFLSYKITYIMYDNIYILYDISIKKYEYNEYNTNYLYNL